MTAAMPPLRRLSAALQERLTALEDMTPAVRKAAAARARADLAALDVACQEAAALLDRQDRWLFRFTDYMIPEPAPYLNVGATWRPHERYDLAEFEDRWLADLDHYTAALDLLAEAEAVLDAA